MASVQTWLHRWAQVEQSVPRGTSYYPDDVDRQSAPPSANPLGDTFVVGGDSPARGATALGGDSQASGDPGTQSALLSRYRHRTRRRREFLGLSLADLAALGGASEERAAGCLSIRDDLPPGEYLTVPFVRRAWRLLWLLDDGGGLHFDFRRSSLPEDRDAPPALQAITFDWRLARSLDMDPHTAQFNLRRMLEILTVAEFFDESDPHGLSPRTYELLRHGRVGLFYKALLLRLFNRYPWGMHDGLPPLAFIQYNALFMTWLLTRCSEQVITAEELQKPLAALADQLNLASDDTNWSEDAGLVVRSVRERYLCRIGRMLGLCRDSQEVGRAVPHGYQATPLAGRVLRWHL